MNMNANTCHRRAGAFLVGLAAVIGLSACDGPRVVAGMHRFAYAFPEVSYAFSGRDAFVELHGNPFGETGEVLATRVTDAMQNRIMGIDTHFTTTPNDTAKRGYRVVIAFNPADDGLPGRVCRTRPMPTKPPVVGTPQHLYVEAAYCGNDGDYTTARGWLNGIKGSDDPRFRMLIGDLTSSLFPGSRASALDD